MPLRSLMGNDLWGRSHRKQDFILPLFSTPVYRSGETWNFSKEELEFLDKVENKGENHGMLTPYNESCNLSSRDGYILLNDVFQDPPDGLRNFVMQQINFYAYEILGVDKEQKFYLTQSWLNVNKKGSSHRMHSHANSLISGILYVSGESCPTVFVNDNVSVFGKQVWVKTYENNLYNSSGWEMENQNGTIILFPSRMQHFVRPNQSDTIRRTISFNSWIGNKMGNQEDKTEVLFR